MSELRRCRGTWAYCDGDCSRCTTTATTQTSMMYLIQPTADVPEKNVGKWIEEDDGIIHGYCSNCGWESIWQETDVFGMNYCPNCGAKMDGKETANEKD